MAKDNEIVAPKKTMEERMIEAMERQNAIAEAALGVSKIQQQQSAPVNLPTPGISVFAPRGAATMPELKCAMYLPWQQKPGLHGFDREEVELLNLLQPGVYTVELTDGSTVPAEVVATVNKVTGKLEDLHLYGPYDPDTHQHSTLFTKELKQMFPSLKIMLRGMIGEPAQAVMPMKEEVARIALPASDPKHLALSVA